MNISKFYSAAITVLIAVHAIILYLMGRVPICKCGYVNLWHGLTYSSENSQHLTDWYTPSHVIHGFIFYWLAHILFPTKNIWFKAIAAVIPEIIWEIIENSDMVIDRYRTETISLDYYGDSVINSVFDVLAMILGFWLARKFPVWAIVVLTLFMELFVVYYIHDNLTLNIIMLIYPLKVIRNWQSAI